MKNLQNKICIILSLLVCTNLSIAQSYYSQRGLGLVNHYVSGRSQSMGGIGLASTDKLSVNYLNPAALTNLPITYISGQFRHESVGLESHDQDGVFSDTNVMGAQFHIPLKRESISLGLGLMPYSTIDFSFESRSANSIDGNVYDRFLEGDGGINTVFLSFAFKPFSRLSVGATSLFYFGTLRTLERVIFPTTSAYTNARIEVSDDFTAVNIRFGMQFKVTQSWAVGAVFTPSLSVNGNKSVFLRNIANLEDIKTIGIEMPASIGVGTNVYITKKFLVGMDYYLRKWSDLEFDGYTSDSHRVGFGAEFSGRGNSINSSYWSRMAVRAGFYFADLGLEDPVGDSVTERFFTFGLGIPIKWNAGRIDLSFEVGQRGTLSNNPMEENIVRVSAGITVGERWFLRRESGR